MALEEKVSGNDGAKVGVVPPVRVELPVQGVENMTLNEKDATDSNHANSITDVTNGNHNKADNIYGYWLLVKRNTRKNQGKRGFKNVGIDFIPSSLGFFGEK